MKAVIKIAKEFRVGLLDKKPSSSQCFVVCSALSGYLSFEGYENELTEGLVGQYQHFWLTLPGGNILDPTADQFKKPNGEDMPDIYYGGQPKWYRRLNESTRAG